MTSMNEGSGKTVLAIAGVVAIGVALAFAGSDGSVAFKGVSVFMLSVILAFAMQWVAFIPAMAKRTESFFDLAGSLTYLSITIFILSVVPLLDGRTILLASMVSIWAARLGWFLFNRIYKSGGDQRFDKIKTSFVRFFGAWTLQGLWVAFTAAAAWAGMASAEREPLGLLAAIGFALWIAGFAVESIADFQKSRFKRNPENKGRFIQSGLWSRSRHPNYFGEIVLWVGVSIVSIPVLQGWQWATLISPLFVAALLLRVSGIPLLEKRADEAWGGQEEYEAYKRSTPVLIPKLW